MINAERAIVGDFRSRRPDQPAAGMRDIPTIEILGVQVAHIDRQRALAEIEKLGEQQSPASVYYANAHALNLATADTTYRLTLRRSDLVLNDGAGLAIAAWAQRAPFPENLNGSDLNPQILRIAARRGWPVYFLGAKPGVAVRAAEILSNDVPELRIVGCQNGYFPPSETTNVISAIRTSRARVLMVAMGNPLQERWIEYHLRETGATLGIGVGAFLDFVAGVVPRAPWWMNRIGMEWCYRLVQEPSRLWRRYVLGNPVFIGRVLTESLQIRRRAQR